MPLALPTREDYFQIGATEVIARSELRPVGQRLSREAVFTEGTDINIIIAACSAMADVGTQQLSLRIAALFLDSAEGEDLDRLVADRFSPTVVRKRAAPSTVQIQFRRAIPPSTGAAVNYPVGQKLRTPQGVEFALTQSVSFPLNSSGPVTGIAQAVLAGTAGNVDAGSITQIAGANPDTTVVITNLEPASGGRDIESDASLRSRARDFYRTARRGTLAAIEFGALTVEGVYSATAIEDVDSLGIPTGAVRLIIADSEGRANTVLADAVKAALLEYRAAGVVVQVIPSAPQYEDIEFKVGFRPSIDQRNAVQQLKSLTVATVNLLAPEEPLTVALLFALARSIPGLVVMDDAIAAPTGDVSPALGSTIKTSLDRVTVNGL